MQIDDATSTRLTGVGRAYTLTCGGEGVGSVVEGQFGPCAGKAGAPDGVDHFDGFGGP